MSIRLVVTITAAPGKGTELAKAYKPRCAEIQKEPGCDQFEVLPPPMKYGPTQHG